MMVLVIKPGPSKTTIYREDFARFHRERLKDYVYSGYEASAGTGLELAIAAGVAYIHGWRVEHTEANTLTMADNATNYVFLDKDGVFTVNQTGSAPSNSILLCEVVTSGGAISTITDKRPLTRLDEDKILFDDSAGHTHKGSGNTGTKIDHADLVNVLEDQHHPRYHKSAHEIGGVDRILKILEHDVIANLPAVGNAGRIFWSTDEHILYLDDGTAWNKCAVRDHADLDGITADDHHAKLHAASHAYGGADDLNPYSIIELADLGVIRTPATSTESFKLQSHDGAAYVDCAKLVGGYLEISRGKFTGDLPLGTNKILFGTFGAEDVNLYRSAADCLRTDDHFEFGAGLVNVYLFSRASGLLRFRHAGATAHFFPDEDTDAIFFENADTPPRNLIVSTKYADATNTLRDSSNLLLRAKYWDGAASQDRDSEMLHRMLSTTPTSELAFRIAGADVGKFRGDKVFVLKRVDVGDYGGNFSTYTLPTGEEGAMVIAVDTNATSPGQRLYIYANGVWRYASLS